MEQLLNRSFQLESEVARLFDLPLPSDSPRAWASKVMTSIAIEHASSAKVLIGAGNRTSAISLFRLQFEAFIRAIWVFHAASEAKVSALCELINESNFKRLNNQQTSMGEMFDELAECLPDHIMRHLEGFRDSSWKPLCSMVHSGVLALQTHAFAFPDDLLKTTVKHSNGISCLTANLLTIISADQSMTGYTTKLTESYRDCLQMEEDL